MAVSNAAGHRNPPHGRPSMRDVTPPKEHLFQNIVAIKEVIFGETLPDRITINRKSYETKYVVASIISWPELIGDQQEKSRLYQKLGESLDSNGIKFTKRRGFRNIACNYTRQEALYKAMTLDPNNAEARTLYLAAFR